MTVKDHKNIVSLFLSESKDNQGLSIELIKSNADDLDLEMMIQEILDQSIVFYQESLDESRYNSEYFEKHSFKIHPYDENCILSVFNPLVNPFKQEVILVGRFGFSKLVGWCFIPYLRTYNVFKLYLDLNSDGYIYSTPVLEFSFKKFNELYKQALSSSIYQYNQSFESKYSQDCEFKDSKLFNDIINLKIT